VSETRVPDDVYNEVKPHFSESQLVALTMLVVAINGWNRMNVAFKTVHPIKQHKAA
jgi:alkylhydroperoxidase family enzyme